MSGPAPVALVGVLWMGALTPAQATTQERPPVLREEVRGWLARDQARRWATMVQTGDSIFNGGSCRRCHGDGGLGGRFGPDLTDSEWARGTGSLEEIRETVFWGVRRRDLSDPSWRFEMNPAGGMNLDWDAYDALAAYVWSLSHDAVPPGG